MRNEVKIRRAYDYLRERAKDEQVFTANDLSAATGWTLGTTKIYLSKKFSEIIRKSGNNLTAERRTLDVSYDAFDRLFRQKNNLFVEYKNWVHPDVTTYEFFLPLSCEDILRAALDRLFFKDTVIEKLEQIGLNTLREKFKQSTNESDDDYRSRIADFAGNKFGGYSVSHVNGRFRGPDLMTREDAAEHEKNNGSYIIDETTAVVRFIIPHQATAKEMLNILTEADSPTLDLNDNDIKDEIAQTEWLFSNLFVYTVTQATTNQDQIWLLETGKNHRLFRYVSEDQD